MRKPLLLVVCLVLVSVVLLGVGCGTTEPQDGTVLEGSESGGSTTEGMTQEQLVQLIQQTVGDMNLKGDKGDTGAQGLQGCPRACRCPGTCRGSCTDYCREGRFQDWSYLAQYEHCLPGQPPSWRFGDWGCYFSRPSRSMRPVLHE